MRKSFASTVAIAALCAGTSWAQPALGPVINPRGVINGFTQQPAPSVVAPGAILWINGINLGPAGGASADTNPLPTELGGVQVMINNRQAGLIRVDPARIVVQVPLEIPVGNAQVVVRRGEASSRPARVTIQNPVPAVRTEGDKGYGVLAATTLSDRQLRFTATGFGVTDPRLPSGAAAAAGAEVRPRVPVSVHVGGIPVEADVRASEKTAGEFDITITLPESALPGDLVTVSGGNRLANTATWRLAPAPEVSFVRLPASAPELRAIAGSDLRGGFFIGSGARTDEGCWPSVLFDLRGRAASNIQPCLTAANRNAASPMVAHINGSALAAFVGPPQAEPADGVSNRVLLFQPGKSEPMDVELPGTALALNGGAAAGFTAILGGTPPQAAAIDTQTGTVQTVEVGGGAAGGAAGAAARPGALNPLNLQVDLGDGLNKVLSLPVNTGPQQFYVAVGDDQADPKKAKMAVLNADGEVQSTRDFPEGWLPMILPPARAAAPGGGGGAPGGGGGAPGGGGGGGGVPGGGLPGGGAPGGGATPVVPVNPLAQFRLRTYFDGPTRTLFVLSRKADNSRHALIAYLPDEVKVIETPESTFFAGCSPNVQILNIETSRRVVLLGSNTAEREFQQVCGALAFLVLDLATQQFTKVDLPGAGQVNATNAVTDINDFLLTASTTGDVAYALDGVTLTAYRFDLPQGITGFAQLVPIPAMEMAVATARARVNGDSGFVVFDLANIAVRQLLLPDGIQAVQQVGILPATRKLVARATRTGGAGSQYVIYDLLTGDLMLPENPEGVVFVGAPPPQPATGGQPAQNIAPMQRVNQKANTIEAITFGGNRRQNGAMLIRVP